MGHSKVLTSSLRWVFSTQVVGIMMMILFTKVRSSDDQSNGAPATGLLCISECSTCPQICSPPPPIDCPPPPKSYNVYQGPPKPKPSVATFPPPPPGAPKGFSNYPYYYFYNRGSSLNVPCSLSTFLLLLLFSYVFYLY